MVEQSEHAYKELRAKAIEILQNKDELQTEYGPQDFNKVIQELRIYQTELEVQNEELQRNQIITQRSLDQFYALFQKSPVGFIILDEQMKIYEINKTLIDYLGFERESLVNKYFNKWVIEEDQSQFIMAYKAIFNEPLDKTMEVGLQNNHSHPLYVKLFGRKISDFILEEQTKDIKSPLNKPINLLFLSVVDITREREKEEQLKLQEEEKQKLQSQVFQAAKMASIGELAAGVAHEINNPLQIAYNYLGNLKRVHDSPLTSFKEYESILDALDRISNIVEGLRLFSHTDGKSNTSFDLRVAVQNTLNLILPIFIKQNIQVFFKKPEEELFIKGHPSKLQQVIMNLLTNARDALLTKNGGKIELEVKNEHESAVIKVTDDGPGIPADLCERIFDSFFSTKAVGEGVGLGLSISQSIIKGMDGQISISSSPYNATCFTITLPLDKSPFTSESGELSSTSDLDSKFEMLAATNLSILVLDDEELICDYMMEFFTTHKFKTVAAINPQQAMEQVKNNKFDLIVCDLKMPGMSGVDFIKKVKQETSYPFKTIFITGDDSDLPSTKELSFHVLHKPFSDQKLKGVCLKVFS